MQAMVQPLIYIEYQLRKEYIVAELCKERYAEIKTCDGRCFLIKKLNDAQQKESEEKERNIKPLTILLNVANLAKCEENKRVLSFTKTTRYFLDSYYDYLLDRAIDKPPRFLA